MRPAPPRARLGWTGLLVVGWAAATLALAAAPQTGVGAANILWSAGLETGDLSEWSINGGGPFISGSGRASVATRPVHSGRYSMRLTISHADGTRGNQAIRMFRYRLIEGSLLPREAYYSVWMYFPVRGRPRVFWDLIQWKTKLTSGRVDPVFVLNVTNVGTAGRMHFYLFDSVRRRTVATSRVPIPVRRWVQIETYYRWSSGPTGRVVVYQDGRRIVQARRVVTELRSRNINARQWSVNNYSDDIQPSTYALFVNDAAITRRRLGPLSWPQVAPWRSAFARGPAGVAGTGRNPFGKKEVRIR